MRECRSGHRVTGVNERGSVLSGLAQKGVPAPAGVPGFVCDQQRVPLPCRARWCAGLWAASLLPCPRLPARTPRPCWPTPSPWLRTPSAPRSSSVCLTKRQSEQVRGPRCQGNVREGTGDLSEPLVRCSWEEHSLTLQAFTKESLQTSTERARGVCCRH